MVASDSGGRAVMKGNAPPKITSRRKIKERGDFGLQHKALKNNVTVRCRKERQ